MLTAHQERSEHCSATLQGAIHNPRHVKPQTHQTPDKHNQDLSNQRHTKPKLRHNVTALEAHRVLGLGVRVDAGARPRDFFVANFAEIVHNVDTVFAMLLQVILLW